MEVYFKKRTQEILFEEKKNLLLFLKMYYTGVDISFKKNNNNKKILNYLHNMKNDQALTLSTLAFGLAALQ